MTELFVRITDVPDPVTADQITVRPRTGGGLDLGGGTAISAGFPPGVGPLPQSRPAGSPVRTPEGRRVISVEDLGWSQNPRPFNRTGPTNTRISPYQTSNPFGPSGINRRTPGTRTAVIGVGANAALDIAYEISRIDQQFEQLPCPEISDQDFYREIGVSLEEIKRRLERANSLAEIREISGSISRVSTNAALGLFLASAAGISAPITVPAAITAGTVGLVSGGVNAITTLLANQGRRNDRNYALFQARGSTARRLELTGTADCPLPSDRELLQRVFDCCFPEIAFTARRDVEFRTVPEPGFVPVLICEVLVLSNQLVTAGWIRYPGGNVELDVSGIQRTSRPEYQEFLGGIKQVLVEADGINFNKDISLELVLETGGRLVYRDLTLPAQGSGVAEGIAASLVIDEVFVEEENQSFTQLVARVLAVTNIPNTYITGVFLNWTGEFDYTFQIPDPPDRLFSDSYPIPIEQVDLGLVTNFELAISVDDTVKLVTAQYRPPAEGIGAIPDYWATRPGAGRPVLVIQFSQVLEDGTLSPPNTVLQIPWYAGPERPDQSPIGPFQKGSYRVDLNLNDNSKVRVHAINEQEALRVIDQASAVINPEYLVDAKIRKSPDSLPEGRRGLFVPRLLKWFPTGQKDLLPAWIVRL